MEKYELTIVLDGKATVSKQKNLNETIEKIIKVFKGKIGTVEKWREKPLSYKIGKSTSGIFIFYPLKLETKAVKGICAKLKMEKEIIKFLLVKKEK